jgi:hypothetical protein
LNLFIHSTAELETLLGHRIAKRTPLHEWPLSSVELLTTAGGSRFAYKVQHEPTVEPEFLAHGHSPLLPDHQLLLRDGHQATLLFPIIEAPTLNDEACSEAALVAEGRALVEAIATIEGDVPVYLDVGSIDAWRSAARHTVDMLTALVHRGIFTLHRTDLDLLSAWVDRPEVLDAVDRTSGIINGDLKSEHVFRRGTGYKVIDWQRPYRAPREIDLVSLLDDAGIPSHRYVSQAVIAVRWFLFLHWVAEARTHLLPDAPFFDAWAHRGMNAFRHAVAPTA